MEWIIKMIASNPATILIAGGLVFLALGEWYAWILILMGIGLNITWVFR